ncbi:zf-TFIIB domain-containing protein [Caballeronia sp. LjRoot34]|uniref:TFIIB-type zinc ribbon-containing protein n=1 Tax=Caballeronia sp. LjRoot34 TaxID=3342325 RepID=UPI003ED14B14
MKCPVCKTPDLLMADRQGIEVDYCPTCRGVWLDRGELDKLIGRAADESVPQAQAAAAAASTPVARRHDEGRHYNDRDRRHGYGDDEYRDRRYPYKKKKSLLGDLFDFG